MKKSHNIVTNSSSASIRNAPAQNVLSDTNEDEKAPIQTLSLDALRALGRIVGGVTTRIANDSDQRSHQDIGSAATTVGRSPAHPGPVGGQDHDRRNE